MKDCIEIKENAFETRKNPVNIAIIPGTAMGILEPEIQNSQNKAVSLYSEYNQDSEKQHIKGVQNCSHIINPDLKFIAKQLAAIRMDLSFTKKQLTHPTEFTCELPINSQIKLDEICELIENDHDYAKNLTKYLIRFAPEENKLASSGIAKLLTDDVIFSYNWDGVNFKRPLKTIVLFKTISFEAWKNKFNNNFNAYESSMRKQIFNAHNREYQRKRREKNV